MAEYINRELLLKDLETSIVVSGRNDVAPLELRGVHKVINRIKAMPTEDAVPVVRCKDCKHSRELERNCEINRNAYRHCAIYRGEEENVWVKYKRYYKEYSIVEPDDYCSYGERKCDDGKIY